MATLWQLAVLCLLAGLAASTPREPLRLQRASRGKRADADPNICGEIIDDVNNGFSLFRASAAYECLMTVPFNDAVALRFIDYYNTTMQFQSTLGFLKKPPPGYQQPAVDVVQGLEKIRQNVTAGVYKTQYVFEADLQQLVYHMHDAHVDLSAGILSVFTFASPYNLMSASIDGKELPQIYLEDHIEAWQAGHGHEVSPVVSINGVDAADFVEQLAALNAVGMLEPHADWNSMMANPAQDIQGTFNTFGGGITFYPGDYSAGDEADVLKFTLKNGSKIESAWVAIYTYPYFTGPLTTGGDFFNYFVLGLSPASYDDVPLPPAFDDGGDGVVEAPTEDASKIPFKLSSAYPDNPDVVQDNWDVSGGGVITGYFLQDVSTAVLSIPSFYELGNNVGTFGQAVTDFITKAQDARLAKVVIDLQQNRGGAVLLAFTTFRQFFPGQTPFAGSRRRSHELANVLGEAFTGRFTDMADGSLDKAYLEASEWVITNRLNAETGNNFSSWAEYFGPKSYNGDLFSLTEQYDLKNPVFDTVNFDGWLPGDYLEHASGATPPPRPWGPQDIVLLTDGACSSTCSLFVEMMTQAGARTVVVGGRPAAGTMQAVSGTRAATSYSASAIDADLKGAGAFPPARGDTGVFVTFAGLSLRDQVRESDEATPLQFAFLPATCRLFFTLDNVYNMSRLWRDVAGAAAGTVPCVDGSPGFGDSASSQTGDASPPAPTPARKAHAQANLDFNAEAAASSLSADPKADALLDSKSGPERYVAIKRCSAPSDCPADTPCQRVSLRCPGGGGKTVPQRLCVPRCNNGGGAGDCPNHDLVCGLQSAAESRRPTSGTSSRRSSAKLGDPFLRGFCIPLMGTTDLGCPAIVDSTEER